MATKTLSDIQEKHAQKAFDEKNAKSWVVAVKVKLSPEEWQYNGLRFYEKGDAVAYSVALRKRWKDIVATEVQPSKEKPNAFYPVPNDRYPVQRKAQ